METIELVRYRRSLKRRNCSAHTVKNYVNMLAHFIRWAQGPLAEITSREIAGYTDYLLRKRQKPKTINCHLAVIRLFFDYLINEEGIEMENPVKRGSRLRMARPLPRHLKDGQVILLFRQIRDVRDRAIFMLMLRCGLRVEEVANLTMDAIELERRQLLVVNGKGSKGRVVYLSEDARSSLETYLKRRSSSRAKGLFLVQKGPLTGTPLSVRGIQKRIEYYGRRTGIAVSCHQLRHTMATQLLNADADLVTIQDLLGHARITTTQRYCKISNLKVQRDYFRAIEAVLQRTQPRREDDDEWDEKGIMANVM